MTEEIKNLEARIMELERMVKALTSNTTIPFDIGEAMKLRVGALKDSTKTVASETETLGADPTGVTVPKLHDGYYLTKEGKHIPYYD